MLGNLIALLIIKVVNQMMFSPSVCVAYSNAPCQKPSLHNPWGWIYHHLIKETSVCCLGGKRRFEVIWCLQVIVGVSRNGPSFVVNIGQVVLFLAEGREVGNRCWEQADLFCEHLVSSPVTLYI